MQYSNIVHGKFIERPNRFIALSQVDGNIEKVHVKNTGRCRELLIPGTDIFLEKHDNPSRKTKYSLIAVKKGSRLINMDSQIPNGVVTEYLRAGCIFGQQAAKNMEIIREKTYGDSRFDIYVNLNGKDIWIEVKGVTLEEDGIARFPDAPTQRGIKHLHGLMEAAANGCEAYMVFVIQMKGVRWFEPNDGTHPEFGQALREAQAAGVHVLAFDCNVQEDSISIREPVEVRLSTSSFKTNVR